MSEQGKADLLNKLKIDEHEQETSRPSHLGWYVGAALFVVGLIIVWLIWGASASSQAESDQPTGSQTKAEPSADTASIQANSQQHLTSAAESAAASSSANSSQVSSASPNQEILNASGYVTARRTATVSAEIMGRIESVLVEEGMVVQEGQVLAQIDHTLAKVDWELSRAQVDAISQRLSALELEREEAERVLNRLKSLDQQQFTNEAAITRATVNKQKLEAEIAAAKADQRVGQLAANRQKKLLDKHTLRAPFSGVVTQKNAQPGEIIAPSSAGGGFTRTGICTLVDMKSLEIEVDVNEAYIGRVFENQKVSAKLDAYPRWEIPAKVIAVIPTADRAKATVRVRIGLMLEDTRILPEMGVKVAFYEASYD